MIDKSWGLPGGTDLRVRSNASPETRATERAQAREERARERSASLAQRLEERSAAREAAGASREQARTERREREERAAAADPHSAAARRRRGSGRKDIVRVERDTSGYATIVDERRIRELARRGASLAGLASAFGVEEAEIERVLRGTGD